MDALAWPPYSAPATDIAPAIAVVPAAEPLFRARRFGARAADLDVDCEGRDRAGVVTRILAACLEDAEGRPYDLGRLWEAPLAWRLQGLLAVSAATRGFALDADVECPREGCGEPLESSLDLRDFAAGDPPRRIEWREGGRTLSVRLPTGLDQRRWAAVPPQDWASMAEALIEEVDGRARDEAPLGLAEEGLEALSARLEEADPMTGLRVEAACPRCLGSSHLELDLEGLVLKGLAAEQRSLLRQVRSLASVFHWSEADILAMPPRRRARYLRMLEDA